VRRQEVWVLTQARGMVPADAGAVARRDGPAPQPPQVFQERRARGIYIMSRTRLRPMQGCGVREWVSGLLQQLVFLFRGGVKKGEGAEQLLLSAAP
jgi:hypothetical protein